MVKSNLNDVNYIKEILIKLLIAFEKTMNFKCEFN